MNDQVQDQLERALTVEQLIEELSNLEGDTPVLFTCNYGDICNTQQALPIKSVQEVDSGSLEDSGYSQSGIAYVGGNEDSVEVYCEKCDEMWEEIHHCPKCNGFCQYEDGTSTELGLRNDPDGVDVVILNLDA